MDKKYQHLLALIARSVEILAEKAMEINQENNNQENLETSRIMREKYSKLYDRLDTEEPVSLSHNDYIDLYIGAGLVVKQIEGKIARDRLAIKAYRTDLIPKLEEIVNYKDEDLQEKVNNLFTVNN